MTNHSVDESTPKSFIDALQAMRAHLSEIECRLNELAALRKSIALAAQVGEPGARNELEATRVTIAEFQQERTDLLAAIAEAEMRQMDAEAERQGDQRATRRACAAKLAKERISVAISVDRAMKVLATAFNDYQRLGSEFAAMTDVHGHQHFALLNPWRLKAAIRASSLELATALGVPFVEEQRQTLAETESSLWNHVTDAT